MMDGSYKVELRKRRRSARFRQDRYPGFRYVRTGSRARSYHWEAVVDGEELAAVRERARADGFEVRAVPAEMARSSTYRRDFLAANPGPHRCRYCRRRLGEGELTVDHLVPVALAQRSATARALLSLMGAEEGVNDPANLVPACPRCNSRKGCKGGLWILRGMLGRHRAYWILLRAAQALLLASLLAVAARWAAGEAGIAPALPGPRALADALLRLAGAGGAL